jgi:hypothetical protein
MRQIGGIVGRSEEMAGNTALGAFGPAGPEKKRRGRAPSEGEPLRRVLIFLGPKESDALRAQAGGRGGSTKIPEILKEHLAKHA